MLSLRFWRNVNRWIGWIALAVLFGLTILVTNIEIKDVDLWLHLASGRHILETMGIPAQDFLSFTVNNRTWNNHEWLFQIITQLSFEAFGPGGLINIRVVVVCMVLMLLVMIGYNDRRLGLTVFLLVLVLQTFMLRLQLRPDMFSLLYFILFMYTLAVQIGQRSSLIFLFIIQVMWVNTHGFFIFAPVLILLMIVAEWAKRNVKLPYDWNAVGRYTDEEFARLCWALLAVTLACFVNPHPIQGAIYPLQVLTSLGGDTSIFFQHIKELEKPIRWDNLLMWQQNWSYRLLIVLSTLSFILNRRRLDIGMFVLWVIFLIFSLNALRNMIFFAVIAYLVILINVQHIRWRRIFSPVLLKKRRLKYMGSLVFKGILITWMINTGLDLSTHGYFTFDTMERKSEFGGITLKNYPYRSADFLVENKIKGNFFNDFNSGAYLLGRAHPDIKVYMDGRTEVYGPDYFKTYLKIWRGDEELFHEHVAKYNITGAFLNSIQRPAPARFIRHLYQDPEWVLVYFDFDAAIFLRDIPANREWIDKFAINLEDYVTPKVDIVPIATKRIIPYEHIQRAQALFDIGFPDKARDEAFEALRIYPNEAEALKVLGKVAVLQGEYSKAFAILRNGLLVNSRDNELRYYFGVSLFHLGRFEEAEQQMQRVLAANPRNTKALVLTALIYASQGKTDIARQLWPRQDGELFTVEETVAEINPDKELLGTLEM